MNPATALSPNLRTAPWKEAVDQNQSLLSGSRHHAFAIIDHSGEAESIGMKMPDTKTLDLRQSQRRHSTDAGVTLTRTSISAETFSSRKMRTAGA